MLSKTLGASRKFSNVGKAAGEFPQLLFVLLVSHSDDYGRQDGDAFTVKHVVFPSSPRSEEEFEAALVALEEVQLIERYQFKDRVVLQIHNFDLHQAGLHRRTESSFPARDGSSVGSLDASEAQIEEMIAARLADGSISFHPFTIKSVERQVRVGSSWMDIVATTIEGPRIVIEVKRQRVSDAAIRQVLKYREMLGGDAVPVVIGNGVALGLQTANCGAMIVSYDDQRNLSQVETVTFSEREITFRQLPGELNLTEPNLTEPNRTKPKEQIIKERFDRWWPHYPKKSSKVDAYKAFSQLDPDDALVDRMIKTLEWQRNTPQWLKRGPEGEPGAYIPLPATWIRKRRFEDEPFFTSPQKAAQPTRPVSLQMIDQMEAKNRAR